MTGYYCVARVSVRVLRYFIYKTQFTGVREHEAGRHR